MRDGPRRVGLVRCIRPRRDRVSRPRWGGVHREPDTPLDRALMNRTNALGRAASSSSSSSWPPMEAAFWVSVTIQRCRDERGTSKPEKKSCRGLRRTNNNNINDNGQIYTHTPTRKFHVKQKQRVSQLVVFTLAGHQTVVPLFSDMKASSGSGHGDGTHRVFRDIIPCGCV